jgi:hypothetical protein
MRAYAKELQPGEVPVLPIELVFNPMDPIYVEHRQTTKKYKKVGK